MICPKCDGKIDKFIVSPWGDGDQKTPIAPYVCAWCASIMLFDLDRGALYPIEEVSRIVGFDVEIKLSQNETLWNAIQDCRVQILSTPNRRKVLR